MTTNTILFILVIVVVLAGIAWLAARGRSGSAPEEGHGVGSEAAAAVEDIVGQLLGVDAHHDHALDGAAPRPIAPSPAGHPATIALEPEATAPPASFPAADGPADDLTRLKGLGAKAAATLASLGVTRYAQLAAFDDADVARADAALGAFKGRIARDRWVEQARYLAAGDVAGFEAVFGRIG